jgi:hypothetical protein
MMSYFVSCSYFAYSATSMRTLALMSTTFGFHLHKSGWVFYVSSPSLSQPSSFTGLGTGYVEATLALMSFE